MITAEDVLFEEIDCYFPYEGILIVKFGMKKTNHRYLLIVGKEKEKWIPKYVEHDNLHLIKENIKSECPYCGKRNSVCKGFFGLENEIYEKISHHPNVRLKFLFARKD